MDKFFISLGLDATEINASLCRGWLYVGMIYMFGLATAFGIMIVFGID